MSQQLINHSSDLKRLRDEGYEIEIRGGYILVHRVPYVSQQKLIEFGTLVSSLTLVANNQTARPDNHVMYFIGNNPCNSDGTIISGIQHSNQQVDMGQGIIVDRSFSNKPQAGYENYYEKFKRYADIISSPAKAIDDSVTEKTFKVISASNEESVFKYIDTNSSRANIDRINAKLEQQKIAIIGLGGTGAYVLDLLTKTPVKEIHLFDGDHFLQHNAFRSPGAASMGQLNKKAMKADYFAEVYSNMHKGIVPHSYFIREECLSMLQGISIAFICIDNNAARVMIIEYLLKNSITFIDVGLGVNTVNDKLIGSVRVTAATSEKHDHLVDRLPGADNEYNEYTTNIQIADLNCLNAAMAVIKWKKLSGFYQDLEQEHHCSYEINVSKIFNEDAAA